MLDGMAKINWDSKKVEDLKDQLGGRKNRNTTGKISGNSQLGHTAKKTTAVTQNTKISSQQKSRHHSEAKESVNALSFGQSDLRDGRNQKPQDLIQGRKPQ